MFQVIWAVQKCFVIYSKILQPKGFNFSLIWIHFHNLTEITFRYFHYISLFLRYVCWRYLTYSCEIYWGNLFCRLNRSSRMTWKILLNLENATGPWSKFKLFKLLLQTYQALMFLLYFGKNISWKNNRSDAYTRKNSCSKFLTDFNWQERFQKNY